MKWWKWQGRREYFAISFYSWGKVAYILMPVRLWNFKGGGPKMQAFCPRIDMLKGNHCILIIREAPLHQSAKMVLSKSIFYVKNQFSKIMPNF